MKKVLFSIIFVLFYIFTYAQNATHVVISEVYGGGGNTGATYNSDFIELYNPTSAPVNLSGWSVQYATSSSKIWKVDALTGTIPAKGFYLLQQTKRTVGANLPTPDEVGTISMSATSGKVALVNDIVALNTVNPTDLSLIDLVGYGNALGFETAPTGTGLSATKSAERKAFSTSTAATMSAGGVDVFAGNGYDSNNNLLDFVTRTDANPQNTASTIEGVINTDRELIAIATSPVNNYTIPVPKTTKPTITFNRVIKKGTGTITIKNITDGTDETINITSTRVIINNAILTINGINFIPLKQYAIQISNEAIKDLANLAYSGILNNTTWSFTIEATPLPITLAFFKAQSDGVKVNLNWKSFSEYNNNYYTIAHSTDGINFTQLQQVKGAGNSNTESNYFITHLFPTDCINYYQLSQTDFNGEPVILETKSVNFSFDNQQQLSIYPNPVKNNVTLSLISESKLLGLKLLRFDGKLLLKTEGTLAQINQYLNRNLVNVETGVYILLVNDKQKIHSQKFIKN